MAGEAPASQSISIAVKHGATLLPINVPADGNVADIMAAVQAATNVHPRGQKLIFKGKVLAGSTSLREAGLVKGSKVMLMASQGVYQGAAPVAARQVAPARKPPPPQRAHAAPPQPSASQAQARAAAWEKTGIVSLRDAGIQIVPDTVWRVEGAARVLDLGGNALTGLPSSLSSLQNLQRLRLSHNALETSGVPWDALCSLPRLATLALDHNRLTSLPAEIGRLSTLKFLALAHNTLEALPPEIGQLKHLAKLEVNHNRLKALPASLGDCSALTEVDASSNFVAAIPSSLSQLTELKTLVLKNNAVTEVPPAVFQNCASLSTLSLQGNPITVEQLREAEGWKEFDKRRRTKYDKQLDFSVLGSTDGFDEGGDAEEWMHF